MEIARIFCKVLFYLNSRGKELPKGELTDLEKALVTQLPDTIQALQDLLIDLRVKAALAEQAKVAAGDKKGKTLMNLVPVSPSKDGTGVKDLRESLLGDEAPDPEEIAEILHPDHHDWLRETATDQGINLAEIGLRAGDNGLEPVDKAVIAAELAKSNVDDLLQ